MVRLIQWRTVHHGWQANMSHSTRARLTPCHPGTTEFLKSNGVSEIVQNPIYCSESELLSSTNNLWHKKCSVTQYEHIVDDMAFSFFLSLSWWLNRSTLPTLIQHKNSWGLDNLNRGPYIMTTTKTKAKASWYSLDFGYWDTRLRIPKIYIIYNLIMCNYVWRQQFYSIYPFGVFSTNL